MTGKVKRLRAIHWPKKSILVAPLKIIVNVTLIVKPEANVACQIWVGDIFKFVYSLNCAGVPIKPNWSLNPITSPHSLLVKIVVNSKLTTLPPPIFNTIRCFIPVKMLRNTYLIFRF